MDIAKGKYERTSADNYDELLKALDVNFLLRKAATASTPVMEVRILKIKTLDSDSLNSFIVFGLAIYFIYFFLLCFPGDRRGRRMDHQNINCIKINGIEIQGRRKVWRNHTRR